jgi:hypothetical protein
MPPTLKKRPLENYPSSVRATERITDEGRICAEPGEAGTVLGAELYEDGAKALTVIFPSECVTTCFLGENVSAVATARA